MPLPFDPQPLDVFQERWTLAIERCFDAESVFHVRELRRAVRGNG